MGVSYSPDGSYFIVRWPYADLLTVGLCNHTPVEKFARGSLRALGVVEDYSR